MAPDRWDEILAGVTATVTAIAGWYWRLRSRRLSVERELTKEQFAAEKEELNTLLEHIRHLQGLWEDSLKEIAALRIEIHEHRVRSASLEVDIASFKTQVEKLSTRNTEQAFEMESLRKKIEFLEKERDRV